MSNWCVRGVVAAMPRLTGLSRAVLCPAVCAGVGVDTPLTLEYGEPVSKQRVMRRPRNIIKGPGDGTVDLATLRLCNK
jgi:hypothetical protein